MLHKERSCHLAGWVRAVPLVETWETQVDCCDMSLLDTMSSILLSSNWLSSCLSLSNLCHLSFSSSLSSVASPQISRFSSPSLLLHFVLSPFPPFSPCPSSLSFLRLLPLIPSLNSPLAFLLARPVLRSIVTWFCLLLSLSI